jgi:hypothetical protein
VPSLRKKRRCEERGCAIAAWAVGSVESLDDGDRRRTSRGSGRCRLLPVRVLDYVLPGTRGIKYDVAPDGRFLLLKDSGTGGSQDRVVLVQNWTEELKRRVRAK